MRRVTVPVRGVEVLFGTQDENLRFLEGALKVRIRNDGSDLVIEGDERGAHTTEQVFGQLTEMMEEGYQPSSGDVRLAAQLLTQDANAKLRDYLMRSAIRSGRKVVVPRSLNQRAYLEQIEKHDLVFGIGPAGTGKCIAADSLVLTDRGMIPIGQIERKTEPGQALPIGLTIHGVDGPEPAAFLYDGGETETLAIRTRFGFAIETTPEHPLLVLEADGRLVWRRADALCVGDTVALQRGQRFFGDRMGLAWTARLNPRDHSSKPVDLEIMDDELAYILGLLVGDGCVTRRNRVILSTADADVAAAYRRFADRLGLHVFPNGKRKYDLVIASSAFHGLLAHLGLAMGPARSKCIPRAILTAPGPMVAAFLSGLFDADGSVEARDGAITFSTVSRTLAAQVQAVLLNFGIVAARSVKRGRYQGRPHVSQLLTITGVEAERFDERIGFRLERKRIRRRRRRANPNVDVVPLIAEPLRRAMASTTLTHAEHKLFDDYRRGRRRPGYSKLERLLALLKDRGASGAGVERIQDLVERHLFFVDIEGIQPSRSRVFDLSVPGTHSFVANGFVNHNTYLAMAAAVAALNAKTVSRIILARPAVEAGEKLGFLPGDLPDKVDPYLRPLYDALYDLLDYEKVTRLLERNAIEIAPIAFMRGRTLNEAFVIIDEAQNTTPEQMKMVLTRIGFGSKAVITGDITQIDLPTGRTSGLVEAISVLHGVKDIAFVHFDEKDVVRHRLVQAIIRAYDAHKANTTGHAADGGTGPR